MLKRKWNIHFFFLLYSFLATLPLNTQAGTFKNECCCSKAINTTTHFCTGHPVFTLTGGIVYAQVGQSETFPIIDSSHYDYSASTGYMNSAVVGIFGGSEFHNRVMAIQIGLGYYQPLGFTGKGIVTQGVTPLSSNRFDYDYTIIPHQLLAETKLLFLADQCFHPYASLGAGMSFNTATNYQVDIPKFLTFSPEFPINTSNVFSYSLGFGMDFDMSKNVRVGVGYRYSSFGKWNFGAGNIDGVPISNTLSQSNMTAQEGIAQLTYLLV